MAAFPAQPQADQTAPCAKVYLVGSGPGDVELLTLKAWRLLQSAEVVVYDRLVSEAVLAEVNPDAERIYVGKKTNLHSVPQGEINQILIAKARAGLKVVRLKGGDPYIFGRGGEEAQELVAAGIAFEVVPGITSAAGAATYCDIPLTHRDYAQSVTFLTGHLKNDRLDLNWDAFAQPNQTLVIYMGLATLPIISRELQAHGLPATTPVAVVQRATQREERVVSATLATIVDSVREKQLASPSLIIVGEVVSLRKELGVQPNSAEQALASAL